MGVFVAQVRECPSVALEHREETLVQQPSLFRLETGLQATYQQAGKRVLDLIRVALDKHAPKREVVADDLGIQRQQLNDALNRNGKNFSVEWLPIAIRYDRERLLLSYLAGLVGCQVVEIEPLTDAEKHAALLEELRASGADVEALTERAYGRARRGQP
jgi:hypothetical protein